MGSARSSRQLSSPAARKMYDAREHTVAEIAEVVGVARSTLYRALDSLAP